MSPGAGSSRAHDPTLSRLEPTSQHPSPPPPSPSVEVTFSPLAATSEPPVIYNSVTVKKTAAEGSPALKRESELLANVLTTGGRHTHTHTLTQTHSHTPALFTAEASFPAPDQTYCEARSDLPFFSGCCANLARGTLINRVFPGIIS